MNISPTRAMARGTTSLTAEELIDEAGISSVAYDCETCRD